MELYDFASVQAPWSRHFINHHIIAVIGADEFGIYSSRINSFIGDEVFRRIEFIFESAYIRLPRLNTNDKFARIAASIGQKNTMINAVV